MTDQQSRDKIAKFVKTYYHDAILNISTYFWVTSENKNGAKKILRDRAKGIFQMARICFKKDPLHHWNGTVKIHCNVCDYEYEVNPYGSGYYSSIVDFCERCDSGNITRNPDARELEEVQ